MLAMPKLGSGSAKTNTRQEHVMRMHTADVREIRDFRAYLRRRRDGKHAPEWLRYVVVAEPGPELGSVGFRAGFAAKPGEPGARKIRRDGQPWCPWLGN